MAETLSLQVKTDEIVRLKETLGDRFATASVRALNRTGNTIKTFMARGLSKDTGMKVSAVKDVVKVVRATKDRQAVQVSVTGARLPLILFNARGPEPSRGRGRGVTAIIQGQRKTYPHAFIAKVFGPTPSGVVSPGHRGVFVRKGRQRLPIRELRGVSLAHVFRGLSPDALQLGRTEFMKNLKNEAAFLLRQGAA